MSVVTKDILKTYFETGDYPTQQQFANLIDSLKHVNDLIGLTDLKQEVIDTINAAADSTGNAPIVTAPGATSVVIPRGVLIDLIVVLSGDGINFSAGWTVGGTDVVDNYQINGGTYGITTFIVELSESRVLYLNGVGVDTIVKLYKR